MEDYLKFKKEQIIKNNFIAKQKVLMSKQIFYNRIQNFEQNLQEVNKKEIESRLIFYIDSALYFGLFKSEVENEIFEKIMVTTNLKEKLIELETLNSVIDSLNEHTVFYFKKQTILKSFCSYSLCYLVSQFNLENFMTNKEIEDYYNELYRSLERVKRQLVEDVKSPRKEDDRLLLEEYRLHKQKHIETTKISPVPLKSFEYILGKYFSNPHKLAYQPLVNYLKELNQDLLKDAFNETEFYVALYDLLKAISHDKEHYKDDDESFIEVDYKNNLKNYKSKVVRNWFS